MNNYRKLAHMSQEDRDAWRAQRTHELDELDHVEDDEHERTLYGSYDGEGRPLVRGGSRGRL